MVTAIATNTKTTMMRIADLFWFILRHLLDQGKAEGQGVGVVTGSSGRAHGYADPILEARKHRVIIRCLQSNCVPAGSGVHFVPFVGQHVEQQLAAGVVAQPVTLGIIVIVPHGVDGHLQLLLLGNGRAWLDADLSRADLSCRVNGDVVPIWEQHGVVRDQNPLGTQRCIFRERQACVVRIGSAAPILQSFELPAE